MARDNSLISDLTLLLQQETAHNHHELCEALKNQGHVVTQSTISRLLRKLGAVKGLNARQEMVYLLPKDTTPVLTTAADFHKLVLSINHNEHLIMLHTTPGSANMIARILDLNRATCHILGTIAGDDTIIVVPTSITTLDLTLQAIKKIM